MTAASTHFRRFEKQTADEIIYKMASTRDEREAAFRLVYEAYVRAGLCAENPCKMRATEYQLLPSTEIFLAVLRGEVIATMSLVCDGDLGLPMEAIYADEVAQRRGAGLHLAEVSCLADRRRDPHRNLAVFLELSRWIVQGARQQGVDELLVAVHPRHARFYRRFMAFDPIADERDYPSVCDHPAVALCLDFAAIDRDRPENYDRFFGQPIAAERLRPEPMSPIERDNFGPIVAAKHSFTLVGPESAATTSDANRGICVAAA